MYENIGIDGVHCTIVLKKQEVNDFHIDKNLKNSDGTIYGNVKSHGENIKLRFNIPLMIRENNLIPFTMEDMDQVAYIKTKLLTDLNNIFGTKIKSIKPNAIEVNCTKLIENVKANIEEKRPIGASVTVVSATEKAINVSATVRLARGYSQSEVEALFKEKLTQYLKEIAFKDTYVSTARLGNLLLDTTGVFDYADFRVNGAMNNVELLDTDVPKVGEISFSYVEVV